MVNRSTTVLAAMALALLLLTAAVAGAQDGGTTANLDELVQGLLTDNGFKFVEEEQRQADFDAAFEILGGTLAPYDNFNLGPPGIDGSEIEPLARSIVRFDPNLMVTGDPLVDISFGLGENPIDAPPFTPAGWNDLIRGSVEPPLRESLTRYAVGDSAETGETGGPPDFGAFDGFDMLTGETRMAVTDSAAQVWPTSPELPRGWFTDATFGPDSALGCGQQPDHFVFCDPSDPGGSQFAHGADFISLEIPAPVDNMGPPYGVEVVFTFDDGTSSVYEGSFEGDLFNSSNHNYVLRFDNGVQFEHLAFDGSSWNPQPTTARMINAGNMITLVLDDSIQPTGMRISTFKTDGSRQPGRVVSFSLPGPNQGLDLFQPTVLSGPNPDGPAGVFDFSDPGLFTDPATAFVIVEPPPQPSPSNTPVVQSAPEDAVESAADDIDEVATTSPPIDTGSGSNTRDIVLVLVGSTALVGGGTYFWRRNQAGGLATNGPSYQETLDITNPLPADTGLVAPGKAEDWSTEDLDGYLLIGEQPTDTPVTDLATDDPNSLGQVDGEDTIDTPTSPQPDESPFPRATGEGSWFRNNRAKQLHERDGEWVDPSTIRLPRLLQRAFDEAPEPPKVITPKMAAARNGMYTAAQNAGFRLPGKALLTDSYDGPTGEPHMFWTVRVAADGSILDTWENAEKGGDIATSICRVEVYQVEAGVWWASISLIDTRTMKKFVVNDPSNANPDAPRPRPSSPEEAMELALTGLTSDGKFIESMDPRLRPSGP